MADRSETIIIVESKYIYDFVREQHNVGDDDEVWDDVIGSSIRAFRKFALRIIPLPPIAAHPASRDAERVASYALQPSAVFPPIVYDPVHKHVIDGQHRVGAAQLRGDTTISAYVGLYWLNRRKKIDGL